MNMLKKMLVGKAEYGGLLFMARLFEVGGA
jgi:hypothetical protein